MKKLRFLLLALITALPLSTLSAQKEEETRRPTWIERVFGLGETKKAESEERKKDKDADDEDDDDENDENDENDESKEKKDKQKADKKSKEKEFTDDEREVLESWQKGNAKWKKKDKPLPPGLQKKLDRGGELPPGWKKKLKVGEKLEPEVAQQARKLPEEILKRLPEIEKGVEILEVGGEIIKVFEDGLEIIDILSGQEGVD